MPDTYELKEKLNRFEDWQKDVIIDNTAVIQLTTDCTIGCKGCGANAKYISPENQPQMPFDFYTELVDQYGDFFRYNATMLYTYEPFDYSSQGKKFRDASFYMREGKHCGVRTGVPKGKEEEVIESLDLIDKITITSQNKKRLSNFIETINKHYPEHEHKLIEDEWIPMDDENNIPQKGIGCYHGIILTPTDVISARTVKPTKENPHGIEKRIVTPENFSVDSLCWNHFILPAYNKYTFDPENMYDNFLKFNYVTDSKENMLDPHIAHSAAILFLDFGLTDIPQMRSILKNSFEKTIKYSKTEINRPLNDFENEIINYTKLMLNKIS